MKKRILCVILSLAAVFSFVGFRATQTWFSSGKNNSQVLSSGGLDFVATGELALKDQNALVLPGETLELKEAIIITNNSTIDSELRVRVECTYDGETEVFRWIEFVTDGNENWVAEDGYLYYCPNGKDNADRRIPAPEIPETEKTTVVEIPETEETTTQEAAAVTDETETTTETTTQITYAENQIPFSGTIKISGDVPIELQNKEMKISFILEAKQADFMEWQNFYNPKGMPTTVEANG